VEDTVSMESTEDIVGMVMGNINMMNQRSMRIQTSKSIIRRNSSD
jgi:hypothetical protein